ncbi:histidinol dehydrogenase [Botrimarina hoheduenensis]|uniref:Histidinol dehydrogenase n=1 Tax=Botrimarina hoheduenensis TaxID=2528000 RepID=A0A5C5WBJ5_9BACT|nr:histidinol dehydrogenase [Botrimarina hoheduenensis]TWT48268.1 Histidinol dehydrogenase [Botrimarina hoheduenensis]
MTLSISQIDARRAEAQVAIRALRDKLAPSGNVVSEAGRKKTIEVFGEPLTPVEVVERICNEVRTQGISAVLRYTAQLDGAAFDADQLRVPAERLAAAHAAADPEFLATIRRIRKNLLRFQTAILHRDVRVEIEGGGALRQRYLPLERVGLCVPGGAAAYPSTVLMTAVPAQAAGVQQLAVVAPPTRFGSENDDLLATCHELGITEVYRMGGAQAVAALAYGCEGVAKVDKIVGPGNLFVALAKRHVFGEVDIDSIAGPSEVIVVADETTPPEFVAADLIAQAEHSPGSAVLITWHEPLVEQVLEALETQLATLERNELTRRSLEDFGALITVAGREAAARLCDELATEHLHLACADPEGLLDKVRCAGAVFLGPFSPVPVGDYAAGPSHVLPTGATARFASGLSSNDFLRSNSVIQFTAQTLAAHTDDIVRVAHKEGLTGHARAVTIRAEP